MKRKQKQASNRKPQPYPPRIIRQGERKIRIIPIGSGKSAYSAKLIKAATGKGEPECLRKAARADLLRLLRQRLTDS